MSFLSRSCWAGDWEWAALVSNPATGQGRRLSRARADPYGRRLWSNAEKQAYLARGHELPDGL